MSQEIEVKYLIDPKQMEAMMSLAFLGSQKLENQKTRRLISTYFDTPDQNLRKNKIALRLRETGDGFVQTIKGDAPSSDGLTRRTELEWPLSKEALDINLIKESSFATIFDAPTLDALKPAFVTDFQRLSVDIHLEEGTVIEMALDQGDVRTDGTSQPICELELELKSGDEQQLLEFSKKLKADHQLTPGNQSKAKRGYALLNN